MSSNIKWKRCAYLRNIDHHARKTPIPQPGRPQRSFAMTKPPAKRAGGNTKFVSRKKVTLPKYNLPKAYDE